MNLALKKGNMVLTSLILASNFFGCAKAPSAGNLSVALQMGTYSTAQNTHPLWKFLAPQKANAAVTSLKMCFKRLRFKAEDLDTAAPDTASENVDFPIGEITIGTTGASLGAIKLAAGNYKRIEFDLDAHCASGKSIQLTNSNGAFSSNQGMTLKFRGNFTANVDGTLTLGIQTILTGLNSYNNTDLKLALESISGDLTN